MEDSEIDHVMSEIHLGCPPATIGPFLSHFTFSSYPLLDSSNDQSMTISVDKDGDLLLPRRRRRTSKEASPSHFTCHHPSAFPFLTLGEQAQPLTLMGRLLSPFSILSHQLSLMLVCRQVPLSLCFFLFPYALSAYRFHHSLFRSGNQNSSYQILYCITCLYSMALCALNSVLEQVFSTFTFFHTLYYLHPNASSYHFPGLLGILLARVAKAVFLTGAPSSHPSSLTIPVLYLTHLLLYHRPRRPNSWQLSSERGIEFFPLSPSSYCKCS